MLIKDLKEDYPLVYEAAIQERLDTPDDDDDFDTSSDAVIDAFSWASAKHGEDFWEAIHEDNFDRAKELFPELFEDKAKFKVGKWYTNGNNVYRKCSKDGEYCKYSECIQDGTWYKNSSVARWGTKESVPIDVSEIQKYLPDGHEDKISNEVPEYIKAHNKKEKSLVGRYLKVLKDNAHGTEYSKGHYTLIKKELTKSSVRDEKGMDFSHRNCNFNVCNVELMPEGFNPDTESKEEFKVGDWVLVTGNTTIGCNLKIGDVEKIFKIHRYFVTTERLGRNGGDINFKNIRKALPHEIPVSNPVEDVESLLEEAERRYPIGTKYKDADSKSSNSINDKILTAEYKPNIVADSNIKVGVGYVYYEGKWAEVIEESNYKGKVVHVDTQEKWDFVWKYYKENSCLLLKEEEYSRLNFYKKENYQILSFDEYLTLNLLHHDWESYIRSLYSEPDKDEFPWEKLENKWEIYSVTPEEPYQKDKFMEPIKVKPYTKSKSRIKLIF